MARRRFGLWTACQNGIPAAALQKIHCVATPPYTPGNEMCCRGQQSQVVHGEPVTNSGFVAGLRRDMLSGRPAVGTGGIASSPTPESHALLTSLRFSILLIVDWRCCLLRCRIASGTARPELAGNPGWRFIRRAILECLLDGRALLSVERTQGVLDVDTQLLCGTENDVGRQVKFPRQSINAHFARCHRTPKHHPTATFSGRGGRVTRRQETRAERGPLGGFVLLVPPEQPCCDIHQQVTSFEAYLWQTLGAVHDAPKGARHRTDCVHVAATCDNELHHFLV